ncbi:hypothetical protein BpHYR1_046800 [Brachionus plicatilis]|uniref:Uncharacterized protein n=1 Tax=Brachionus plicatilis TaxID=10195 RepID=A0A3M7P1H5_BRAPC|nr:hypothetical protein BpHYR1_046800 [Brachionus plicatilis]
MKIRINKKKIQKKKNTFRYQFEALHGALSIVSQKQGEKSDSDYERLFSLMFIASLIILQFTISFCSIYHAESEITSIKLSFDSLNWSSLFNFIPKSYEFQFILFNDSVSLLEDF